ncbi:hypothetical protein IMZ31_22840 (plasmid) [Pontibacillus sp. ALD_SL1]|uniref:hypothetical protein n=1 Tax=Pontibacillus sp. ALD_SL1 TaxID=2777185 RepID=UPI001A96F01B|nr:hypothetical protein [Pontibacillus sp. ALD_SL1]QST02293.1 hypothetical protein IMZ31_22840 [Pontibacillus sp. ALD_SL1]
MKKWLLVILALLCVSVAGCSEAKEEFVDAFNQKSELGPFMVNHDEVMEVFNTSIDDYNLLMEQEDLSVIVAGIEDELIPVTDEAVSLSKKIPFDSESFSDLQSKRTEAIEKHRESFVLLADAYSNEDWDKEEEAYGLMDEAYEMFQLFEAELIRAGEEMNEEIVLE